MQQILFGVTAAGPCLAHLAILLGAGVRWSRIGYSRYIIQSRLRLTAERAPRRLFCSIQLNWSSGVYAVRWSWTAMQLKFCIFGR